MEVPHLAKFEFVHEHSLLCESELVRVQHDQVAKRDGLAFLALSSHQISATYTGTVK